jgi:hypothetical protein
MINSMQYTRAVPFSHPAGLRRIEVFSPNIGRRLSLGGYDAYRTWLVIETIPLIVTFCERPTYVDGPSSTVIDFWVQMPDDGSVSFVTISKRSRCARFREGLRTIWASPVIAVTSWFGEC